MTEETRYRFECVHITDNGYYMFLDFTVVGEAEMKRIASVAERKGTLTMIDGKDSALVNFALVPLVKIVEVK